MICILPQGRAAGKAPGTGKPGLAPIAWDNYALDSLNPYEPAPAPHTAKALTRLAYALAVLLLAWRYLSGDLHFDGALVGLMARAVLRGDFHVFFFGNNYMGTLDSLLVAPALWLFGPSSLVLNLYPPMFYLGTMVVLHRIMGRFFPAWGVLAGLFYLALPPAYGLFWAGEARIHYLLALFLSALLMLLSIRMWEAKSISPGRGLVWGLVAGLAFWTHFLSAPAIAVCGIFLLTTRMSELGFAGLACMAFGFCLGAAPVIYYDAAHGWPHLGLGGEVRLGPETGESRPYTTDSFWRYLSALGRRGLPIILGVRSPHLNEAPLPVWGNYLFTALCAGLAAGFALLAARGLRPRHRPLLMPPALMLLSLLAVTATHYGIQVEQSRARYLVWLYICLPFCWAALASVFSGRRAWPALVICLFLIGANVSGYASFRGLWRAPLLSLSGGYHFTEGPKLKSGLAGLKALGVSGLYVHREENKTEPYVMSFVSGGAPEACDLWRDKRPKAAARVDLGASPGFWAPIGPSARLLGLGHAVWQGRVFYGFAQPKAEALIADEEFTARTLGGRDLGRELWDQNLRTGFTVVGPQKQGAGLVLDLGRERMASGLAMVPDSYTNYPRGLGLEAAGENGAFEIIREVKGYWGPFYVSGPHPFLKNRYPRVECYFAPRPVRYLRLTHLGEPGGGTWSVRELLAFGPGGSAAKPGWEESLDAALRQVKALKLKRLYADAWASAGARLALGGKVWTLPSNWYSNANGSSRPTPRLPLKAGISPGTGYLVNARDAGLTAKSLTRAGVSFSEHSLGRFQLFTINGKPEGRRLAIKAVRSNRDSQNAAWLGKGLSGDRRWAGRGPQKKGVYLEIELKQPSLIQRVLLENTAFPNDYPRSLSAMLSDDGVNWRGAVLHPAGPLFFTGLHLAAEPGAQSLWALEKPVRTRYLRLVLEKDDPVWWWSVQRLSLSGD